MKNILWILLGVLFIAILAQVQWTPQISGYEIPITGQTLGVILVAYVLPRKLGLFLTLAYVLIGGFGLPVFANFSGGIDVIIGKSGGYIIGFVLAAWFISACFKDRKTHTLSKRILVQLIATIIILFTGFLRLSMLIGWVSAFEYGVLPFLIGGLIKVILGAWLSLWIDRKGIINI